MGELDRRKHDIDVMERVVGSLADREEARTDVMEQRPWLAGTIISAVHVTVHEQDDHSTPSPQRKHGLPPSRR